MKSKKAFLYLCLLCCCVGLPGCVYLRLYQVKSQLRQFDKYFEIVEGEKFSLVFKEPVFYPHDIIWIMKSKPTSQDEQDKKLVYDYTLEKQYLHGKNETGSYNLTAEFVFIDDMLSEVRLEKRVFAIFPKPLLIALLKAMGGAKVDMQKRSVSAKYQEKREEKHEDRPKEEYIFKIPDVNEITSSLGIPYSQQDNVYTYKYLHKKPSSDANGKEIYSTAEFTFDKDTHNLLACESELYGAPVKMKLSSSEPNEPNSPAGPENTDNPKSSQSGRNN